MKERVPSGKVIRPAPTTVDGTKNRRSPLVASSFFVVEMFELKDPQDFRTRDFRAGDEAGKSSVQILVAVEGCAVIEVQGADAVTLAKGDAVVVPASIANFHVRPQWAVEFLKASMPGRVLPDPATRM